MIAAAGDVDVDVDVKDENDDAVTSQLNSDVTCM